MKHFRNFSLFLILSLISCLSLNAKIFAKQDKTIAAGYHEYGKIDFSELNSGTGFATVQIFNNKINRIEYPLFKTTNNGETWDEIIVSPDWVNLRDIGCVGI